MNYTVPMRFEWDEGKSESCFLLRGFDFAYAAHAFADPTASYGKTPGTATEKTATP